MKTFSMVRLLMYLAFLGAMVFSGLQLGTPRSAKAEAGCCTYGQDCTTKAAPKCCVPGLSEADCSQSQRNYCRSNGSC